MYSYGNYKLVTSSDFQIRQDIIVCGLMAKDIRLIRKKDTGNVHRSIFLNFKFV